MYNWFILLCTRSIVSQLYLNNNNNKNIYIFLKSKEQIVPDGVWRKVYLPQRGQSRLVP